MDNFKYQEFKKLDRDVQRQLVTKYLELTNHRKFDENDFKSWLGKQIFFDERPVSPEDETSTKVLSLSEILKMSDEEASKWNVLKYKRDYIRIHEEIFNERRNDAFVTGETYGEMMEAYMKEKGLTNFEDVYDADFLDWTDQRGMEWMNQKHGEEGEEERKEMYRVIERYVTENENPWVENKIDYNRFKEWARRNSIPLPKQLENYMEKKIAKEKKKRNKVEKIYYFPDRQS